MPCAVRRIVSSQLKMTQYTKKGAEVLTYAFGLLAVSGGTRRLLVLRHRSDDEPFRLHHFLLPRRGIHHANKYPRPSCHGVLPRLELEEGVVVRVQQVLVPFERGGVVWKLGSLAFSGVDVEGDIVWYLAAGGLNCRGSIGSVSQPESKDGRVRTYG